MGVIALQRLEELATHVVELRAPPKVPYSLNLFCQSCDGPIFASRQRKKFCSDKCRDSWHSMHRDYEPRNTRVEFALTVLRFMEKQFPDQTVKMRSGFDKKRREKNE